MGRRRQLIELLFRTRALSVFGLRHRALTVLAYHRIRSSDKASSTASSDFDEQVFGPDAETFRAQMAWLAQHATPIGEADLLAALDGRRELPPRAVLVTFDDGYKDNHAIALPILRQFDIKALFFVAPALLDERRLGFWDQIAWLLKQTTVQSFTFAGQFYDLSANRADVATALCRRLKSDLGTAPGTALAELALALQTSLPPPSRQDAELMTWADVRDLAAQGMAIGAHGMTHRIMSALSVEAQTWELVAAKQRLEELLSQPVHSVAFPSGSPEYVSPATPSLAAALGYKACFTFETGVNPLGHLERTDIRRVPAGDITASIACAVTAPWLLGEALYV